MKQNLTGLTTAELESLMQSEDLPRYRGRQIAEWIYRHGARSFAEMSNIPEELRGTLAEKYDTGRPELIAVRREKDGTAKLLLGLADGAGIETVALPYADRFSCCLSTQAGCPVGCLFCASGRGGFIRNLQPGEITGQVLAVQDLIDSGEIRTTARNRRIDHIVFMGMGEPLLNYDSTLKAVRLLNDEMNIGIRNITISTVGIVPGIYRLAGENLQVTLAVSLHAPDDMLRKKLVPGVTRWSVGEIILACREYIRLTGRRVTFEYCLLEKVNDSPAEALELSALLSGLNCHVNLIRFNPVPGLRFNPSSPERVRAFRNILLRAGIQTTQRLQRGAGIDAACGQLRQAIR